MAAAAAFLQRAVELTLDPARRAERGLAAAQANSGRRVRRRRCELLASAEAGPLDELQRARVEPAARADRVRLWRGRRGPGLLLKAAKRLEPLDGALARETYLDAWFAAVLAGQFARAGDLHEVSRAARSAPPPADLPRPSDLLLDGLAVLVTEGRAQAAPMLRRAVRVFAEDEIAIEEGLRWAWQASWPRSMVWDEETWSATGPAAPVRPRRRLARPACDLCELDGRP